MRLAEQDRRDAMKIEWQQVGLIVDRFLLCIFVIVTVTVTLVIMLRAPHGRQFLFGTINDTLILEHRAKNSLGIEAV